MTSGSEPQGRQFLVGLKYKASDHDGVTYANSSRAFRTRDAHMSLAKVEDCPCEDGQTRRAFATAEPEGFFVVPACCYVDKKTVGGRLVLGEEGWRFEVDRSGRNAELIKKTT